MSITKIKAELAKRLVAMQKERDALLVLESEAIEQGERMDEACDHLRCAIERLSEVV